MSDAARGGDEDITGINVTPLVDITLVLLIVFLVTAKLVAAPPSIPMVLPRPAPQTAEAQRVLSVGVAEDGALTLNGQPVDGPVRLAAMSKAQAGASGASPDEARVVLRASRATRHGAVIGVIDALRAVGITKIAFAPPGAE